MPPKQRITREMILERSFVMFCNEGMEAVNARSVARALNCSTQPIFSYYTGMDDLKNALELKAKETFETSLAQAAKDGDPLVNACAAYVLFAQEQPMLFAHLFMRPAQEDVYQPLDAQQEQQLASAEAAYAGVPQEKAVQLCTDMAVYAHGLAALAASGRRELEEEQLKTELSRMCESLKK